MLVSILIGHKRGKQSKSYVNKTIDSNKSNQIIKEKNAVQFELRVKCAQ